MRETSDEYSFCALSAALGFVAFFTPSLFADVDALPLVGRSLT